MSEKTNEWISVKQRLPQIGQKFVVLWDGGGLTTNAGSLSPVDYFAGLGKEVAYWLPIPPPPKSEAEQAWDKWSGELLRETDEDYSIKPQAAFLAGFEAGKGAKG